MSEVKALRAFNQLFSRKSSLISRITRSNERYEVASNAIRRILEDGYLRTHLATEDLESFPAFLSMSASAQPADSMCRKPSHIRQLAGVCSEAIEILGDKELSGNTTKMLRRLKPIRQADAARLMDATGNYTEDFAMAIVLVTPHQLLKRPKARKRGEGISERNLRAMKRKMAVLERDAPLLKSDYATKMLKLVFVEGYVRRLLENPQIASYLRQHHPDRYQQMSSSD